MKNSSHKDRSMETNPIYTTPLPKTVSRSIERWQDGDSVDFASFFTGQHAVIKAKGEEGELFEIHMTVLDPDEKRALFEYSYPNEQGNRFEGWFEGTTRCIVGKPLVITRASGGSELEVVVQGFEITPIIPGVSLIDASEGTEEF